MKWNDDRLKVGNRLSGYSIVPDEKYLQMWRVKSPDSRLSDMVNRTRAKDAAMAMFDRELRPDIRSSSKVSVGEGMTVR
jgi:hypothetical protein